MSEMPELRAKIWNLFEQQQQLQDEARAELDLALEEVGALRGDVADKLRAEALDLRQAAANLQGQAKDIEAQAARLDGAQPEPEPEPEPEPPKPEPEPSARDRRIRVINDYVAKLPGAWNQDQVPAPGKMLLDARDAVSEANLALLQIGLAIIEHEALFINTFHCDSGNALVQSLCHKPVTADGISRLVGQSNYGAPGTQQGVGLSALTTGAFVLRAHKREGGAARPFNQCVVMFEIIHDWMEQGWGTERILGSYHAGPGNWQGVDGQSYIGKVMPLVREWVSRLAVADPDPVDPDPPGDWITLRAMPGKQGAGWYVERYPTHYNLRPDVRKFAERYLNLPRYKRRVWMNTYRNHPPGIFLNGTPRDADSWDTWGWRGRGYELNDAFQKELTKLYFNDKQPPPFDWMISNSQMWSASGGWGPSPAGPAGSDAAHTRHIHITARRVAGFNADERLSLSDIAAIEAGDYDLEPPTPTSEIYEAYEESARQMRQGQEGE
jgi:hypothetical protein